jgi:hypothetical protein
MTTHLEAFEELAERKEIESGRDMAGVAYVVMLTLFPIVGTALVLAYNFPEATKRLINGVVDTAKALAGLHN